MKLLKYAKSLPLLLCVLSLAPPASPQRTADEMLTLRQLNLMPVPASTQMQPGRLPITGGFKVAIGNYADDRLRSGIARMLSRLAGRTVLTMPAALATDQNGATLVITCERAGDTIPSLAENIRHDRPGAVAKKSPDLATRRQR